MTAKTGELKSTKDFWKDPEASKHTAGGSRERSTSGSSGVQDARQVFERFKERRTSKRELAATSQPDPEPTPQAPPEEENSESSEPNASGHKALRRTSSLLSSRQDNIFIQQEKVRLERKSSLKDGQISVETIEKAKALAELEKAKMKQQEASEHVNGDDKNQSEKEDETAGPRRKLQRRTQRDDIKTSGQTAVVQMNDQEPSEKKKNNSTPNKDPQDENGKKKPKTKDDNDKKKTQHRKIRPRTIALLTQQQNKTMKKPERLLHLLPLNDAKTKRRNRKKRKR